MEFGLRLGRMTNEDMSTPRLAAARSAGLPSPYENRSISELLNTPFHAYLVKSTAPFCIFRFSFLIFRCNENPQRRHLRRLSPKPRPSPRTHPPQHVAHARIP